MNQEISNENKRLSQCAITLCSIIFTLIALDISGDYKDGIAWSHITIEILVLLISLIGISYFGLLYYRSTQTQLSTLKENLALANAQAQTWRKANKDLIAGLSVQIQHQFDLWQLTHAEVEVGLLILKGLSHQEIAEIRNTSERTIREQARAIYRKSGLSSRSELSAFFLEDLLLPLSSK